MRAGIFVLALLLIHASAQAADGEIKLGVALQGTGPEEGEGGRQLKLVQLAVKEVNAAGGINGKQIKIVYRDTVSTPAGTVDAVKDLGEKEKVAAIIAPIKSFSIVAIAPTIEKLGIPTIMGGTNPRLTNSGNKWLFRTRPDDQVTTYAMAKFIKDDLKITKLGIVHENDVFGNGGANFIAEQAKIQGLQLVKRESYEKGAKDMKAQFAAVKAAGAQAVVVYATSVSAAAVERSHFEASPDVVYVGSPSSAGRSVIADAKEAAEKKYAVVDAVIDETDVGRAALKAYGKEYSSEPDTIDFFVYDGVKILANAWKEVGIAPEKVRDYILKIKGYKGAMGTYAFTPNGEGIHTVTVVQIKNGKPGVITQITKK